MAKKAKSKGRIVQVDFTNVKESGGGVRVPEADYAAKIQKIDLTESQKSGDTMIVVHFKLKSDSKKANGKVIKDNIVLTEKVLWRLRNLLLAIGKKVPKSIASLNLDSIEGEELAVTVVDGDEYKGRIKSEIAGYLSLEDFEEESDDEDEDEDDDDDDAEESEDDDEDLDEIDVDEI